MSFMTYEEIGKEMNISKQAVNQLLNKAIDKTFKVISNNTDSPFDAIKTMTMIFNINNNKDFQQMYKILNKKYKQEIENDKEWKANQQMC